MKNRNGSIDLLKVVAAFMILTVHYLGWGGAIDSLSRSDVNYYLVIPIYFVSGIGNLLFFLISGYFLGKPKPLKIILIERKTVIYSFYITLFMYIFFNHSQLEFLDVVKSLFPLLFYRYWFIAVYLILYTFSAVLHPGLQIASKQAIAYTIIVLLFNNTVIYDANMTFMQGLLTFVAGFYLRKYEPLSNWSLRKSIAGYIFSVCIYVIERIGMQALSLEHGRIDVGLRYVLTLCMAVMLFLTFLKIKIKWRWPTMISSHVIAVYLIASNLALSGTLYSRWLCVSEHAKSKWFILYYLLCVIILFVASICVDVVIDKVCVKESNYILNIFRSLKGKIERRCEK